MPRPLLWTLVALGALVAIPLLIIVVTSSAYVPYVIPTGNMEDTLLIGDHILMPRSGDKTLARGDIAIFRYPVDESQTFIKRVVGVPGDRIRIVNKELYLNGVAAKEPYVFRKTDYVDSYRDNFPAEPNVHVEDGARTMLLDHVVNGEVVVPAGNYFVMGDNRDASLDSRYWGFVPESHITGKPAYVYWSMDSATNEIRWGRTAMAIHGYALGR